jgi:hypothetical protein
MFVKWAITFQIGGWKTLTGPTTGRFPLRKFSQPAGAA